MTLNDPLRTTGALRARGLLVAALSVGLSLAAPPIFVAPAHAQEGMTAEDMERFKLRVSDGKRLFEMEKYRAAIEQFQAARELHDHPLLTFNIAQAFKALAECGEARQAFSRYLDFEEINDEMRSRAERQLAELDEACVEYGSLRLRCDPEEAEVLIAPVGAQAKVDLLDDEPPGSDAQDAESYSCAEELELPIGSYQISARAPGFTPVEQQVEVARGTSQVVHLNLSSEQRDAGPDIESIIAYSLIGAGAAVLAGGLWSDYSSVSRIDELKNAQQDGDFDQLVSLQDEASSASTRTIILYGVGGALLVGGAAWKIVQLSVESDAKFASSANKRAKSADQASFSVDFGLTGVQTRFIW